MSKEKGRPATGRPSEDAATKPLFEVQSTDVETIPAQLRRRRAASYRCPPMADGRRDPVSAPVQSRTPRTLRVEVGRHTAWLFGDKTFDLLDAVGLEQRQWDHHQRVWMIPVQYADDVIAWAEWKQRRVVTCEAIDR